jgi:DNA polymerase-1
MGELSHYEAKTGVVFGFFGTLLKLWEKFHSTNFVFCWDSRKRFRSSIYPQYKANRLTTSTPAERKVISDQMSALRQEILPAFGFKNSFLQTGYEADDLIAQVVLTFRNEFIVVSTDKDLLQLLAVAACKFIYNIRTKTKTDRDDFELAYDISPFDWKRVKAMAGDTSDNVPGVAGVGEKSAIAFLKGKLKGKRHADILNAKEILARNLLLMELPLRWPGHPIVLPKLAENELSLDKMVDVFDQHGFQSFLRDTNFTKWKELVNG